jgi:hypothetical protein
MIKKLINQPSAPKSGASSQNGSKEEVKKIKMQRKVNYPFKDKLQHYNFKGKAELSFI